MTSKRRIYRVIASIFIFGIPLLSSASHRPSDLVAHEWGTFTSLQGSDGRVQPGMHHEEEALPTFVHGRDNRREGGLERCCFDKCLEICTANGKVGFTPITTQKMETPVIYFYSSTQKAIRAKVDFPHGIISQYYPKPTSFLPELGKLADKDNLFLATGSVTFDVELQNSVLPIPAADSKNIYNAARQVASNYLTSQGENEKFIFYRGLGNFETSLRLISHDGAFTILNSGHDAYPDAFLVDWNGTGGYIIRLGEIAGDSSRTFKRQAFDRFDILRRPLGDFLDDASRTLGAALQRTGLYPDEVQAMVNTWKLSYFLTPGFRVLYILPRTEVDQILPLKITPLPDELLRTMVGRVEVFTDIQEKKLLQDLRIQGSDFKTDTLGRMAESKLHRVKDLTSQRQDIDTINALIQKLH